MLIAKGQNVPVEAAAIRVIVGWKDTEFAPDVHVSALLLCPNKVRSDDDFVTPETKMHRSGTVRYAGSTTIDGIATGNLLIALAGMDPPVQRIALVGTAIAGYFGQLSNLYIQIVNAAGGAELARFDTRDAGRERVFVLGELYRRDAGWRFRAVGQGYRSGLAGLANDFGLTPREDGPPPPEPRLPRSEPAPTRPRSSRSQRPAVPAPAGPQPPGAGQPPSGPPSGQPHGQPQRPPVGQPQRQPQGSPPHPSPPGGRQPGRFGGPPPGYPPPPAAYPPPGRYPQPPPGVRPATPPPGHPAPHRQPPPPQSYPPGRP
ncbi:hypothetical protein GCM10009765_27130 [Fodinicola feengrottensis]|uniref:TerD domain-containing protein n=1 Tax=Fodinicola feengrottensis TaxID=435914 RepID=A0ABN2GT15_9ACTN